jgi:hypothetical protein
MVIYKCISFIVGNWIDHCTFINIHAWIMAKKKNIQKSIVRSAHVFESDLEQVDVIDEDLVSDLGAGDISLLIEDQLE